MRIYCLEKRILDHHDIDLNTWEDMNKHLRISFSPPNILALKMRTKKFILLHIPK